MDRYSRARVDCVPTAISLALEPIPVAVPDSLYQQIVDAVKREIGAGRLAPGRAPSPFRALAEELVVSVTTEARLRGVGARGHHLSTPVLGNLRRRSRGTPRAYRRRWEAS